MVIDVPFNFFRALTIPPSTQDTWKRFYGSVFWPFASTFFFISFGLRIDESLIVYLILTGLGCAIGVFTFFTTYDRRPPGNILVFAIIAFIMGIVWINFLANVIVDLIQLLGYITGLNPAFLGLTILAWGNSVADMAANSSVAKKGYAKMAITGCIAGPLFNLNIGIGLATLKNNLTGITNTYVFTADTHSGEFLSQLVIGAVML